MAGKPNSRNWSDVQLVILSIALALTLSLWNIFAGPDRAKASNNQNVPIAQATETALVAVLPTPIEPIKIMLGGAAPNQSQPQQASAPKPRRSGGGGGSTGGGGTGGGGGGTGGS